MPGSLKKIKIAPSLLSANFAVLADEIQKVEKADCDLLHVDVMDGHFVPNLTVGPFIVKAIRSVTKLPIDVHLMIEKPWKYIDPFVAAGASHITVHAEACPDNLGEVLDQIRGHGISAGASVKPASPISLLTPYLERMNMILIMSVNPGFGGQSFMPEAVPKIRELRSQYSGDIEVDGGITPETAGAVKSAGANVLVAGTAVFKSPDYRKTIMELRS